MIPTLTLDQVLALLSDDWPTRTTLGTIVHMHATSQTPDGYEFRVKLLIQTIAPRKDERAWLEN